MSPSTVFTPPLNSMMKICWDKLSFLVIEIIIARGGLTFGIYRKPVSTDLMVLGVPGHNSMIHRLVTVPLTVEVYKNEISIIKHIASLNSIKVDTDAMIRRKYIGFALGSITINEED